MTDNNSGNREEGFDPLDYQLMNENDRGRIVAGVWTATQLLEMRDEDTPRGEGEMILMLDLELHLTNGLVVHVMVPEGLLPGLIQSASGVWQTRFPDTGLVRAQMNDADLEQLLQDPNEDPRDPDRVHDDE